MLRLFQTFNPATILLLMIYCAAVNFHALASPVAYTEQHLYYTSDLILRQWADASILTPRVIAIANCIFIFIQGILLSILMQSFKLIAKPSLIPAMVFILLHSLFPELLQCTPQIFAGFALIWSLFKIFNAYNKVKADSIYLDTGLLSGIALLLFFPAVMIVLFSWLALVRMRSTTFREFLIYGSGVFVICFLAGVTAFWYGKLPEFLQSQFYFPSKGITTGDIATTENIVKLVITGVLLIVSLTFLTARFNSNLIQIRKYLGAFIWLLLFSAASFFLLPVLHISGISFLLVPVTLCTGYYFYHTRNPLYAELIHLVLFAATFIFQYINFAP